MESEYKEELKMKKEESDTKKNQTVKNLYTFFLLFLSFLFSLFFISCRSVPRNFDSLLQKPHLPLDSGARVYVLANTEQARPVINLLPIKELQDRQTMELLERTDFFTAALFPNNSPRVFQIAAFGRYPSSRAQIALGANRHWDKKDGYWYAESAGLSIAIEPREAFAVSTNNRQPIAPRATPPGVSVPDGFNGFSKDSPFSLWFNNSALLLSQIMESAGIPLRIPVQEIFINVYTFLGDTKNEFEILIRLGFDTPSQARGAISVLGFASAMAPPDLEITKIFLANAPVLNENYVDIKSARLTEDELRTLLTLIF